MKFRSALLIVLIILGGLLVHAADDPAKGHYESALFFLESQKYQQAVDDLTFIVKSFPQSPYADEALLQLGTYYLNKQNDLDKAFGYFQQIKDNYTQSNSAPAAYYYLGQIYLMRRTPADLDEAYANFQRVTLVFPSSSWVDKSLVGAGNALKWRGEFDKAYEEFAKVKVRFANSPLAPAAQLEMGICSLYNNQVMDAAFDFQQLIERFPGSPEAKMALDFNTIIYRLYVAPPAERAAYAPDNTFSLGIRDLDEPSGLAIDSKRNIYLSDRGKKIVYTYDPAGKLNSSLTAVAPSSVFVDDRDQLFVANSTGVISPGKDAISFTYTRDEKQQALEEIRSVAVNSYGDYFVVSEKAPGILVYDRTGAPVRGFGASKIDKEFAKVETNARNQVYALDKQRKQVVLFAPDGKIIFTLGPKGQGFEFDRIEDFALDRANNIYMLTKNPRGVLIFSPTGSLLKFIGSEKKGPVAFEDGKLIAVDPSGAIFILDKDQHRVLKIG